MLLYLDTETHSPVDLRAGGAYRYAAEADILVLSYAFDDAAPQVVATGRPLTFADLPRKLRAYLAGSGKIVAYNCAFDRAVLNYSPSFLGGPYLPPERFFDCMAQAVASNLPADLEGAVQRLTGEGKDKEGKRLIRLFSVEGASPAAHPEAWQAYCAYAARDIAAMRDVWRCTRSLTEADWLIFWASERINELGILFDRPFVEAAARLAVEAEIAASARVRELTGGRVKTIKSHKALAEWVYDRIDDHEALDIMTLRYAEIAGNGEHEDESEGNAPLLEDEISIGRDIVERLIVYFDAKGSPDPILREVLELRFYGASAAPTKFRAMLAQAVDDRLRGQFVFNGAAQTGRWSGRGVQLHNMTRKTLGADPGDDYGLWEAPTLDRIAAGCTLAELEAFGLGEPALRKLALLVRPSLLAKEGHTLVKADYSQIEARVLPWLATGGDEPGCEGAYGVLEAFAEIDCNPQAPDIYRVTAANMLGLEGPDAVSKEQRQVGKVAILSLGFSGGVRAFTAMAKNYGVHIPAEQAHGIVQAWRAANPWAPRFWGQHGQHESFGLWGAAMRSYQDPGSEHRAGRVGFLFEPGYLQGTLFMELPSGRILSYPYCSWREHKRIDKKTKQVLDVKHTLVFRRPHGHVRLYGGLLAENATQATANDLLREALYVLHRDGHWRIVAHTHDEIVLEVPEADAECAAAELLEAMRFERPWTAGLPIGAEVTIRFYYSAAKVKGPAK